MQKMKERAFRRIITAHDGVITSAVDLIGDRKPSALCLLLGKKYRKLFESADDKTISRQIAWRHRIHPLIKTVLPMFMAQDQMIENREALTKGNIVMEPDAGIQLPKEPVIWMGNHGFRDDAAATLNAIYRHAYIFLGSLPQFYNTFDGITADLNGVVMMNRKVKENRNTCADRVVQVLRQGMDMIIYPEGVWNKTPNQLILPLWPGIYRIAKEAGTKIVPVVHYVRDPLSKNRIAGNEIHTVIDDPISIEGMSEKAALEYLRDVMATWYYLLMERYGKITRGGKRLEIIWMSPLHGNIS